MPRRVFRWSSPVGFVLVGLCFFFPFVVVSCDAPGGFGRSAPGGETTYTGITLATGAEPTLTKDKVRPPEQQKDDQLPPQAAAIVVLALVAAGAGLVAIQDPRVRRIAASAIAGLAALMLVVNQVTVRQLLVARLREQLTVPIPVGKTAEDFVQTRGGFWTALLLLVATGAGNLIALAHARRRAVPTSSSTGANDYHGHDSRGVS